MCHRGATGRIPARLWISQAAAQLLNGSHHFCLGDENLAVPISDLFFFFLFFPGLIQKQPRNDFLREAEKQRVKELAEGGEREKEEMAQASVYVIQSDDSLVHGAKPTPIAFLPLEPGRSSNSTAGLSHRGKGSGAPARPAARRDPLRVTQSPTLLRAGGSRARGEAAEKRQSARKT